MPSTVWTVGHSTRPIEQLLAVLRAHDIELVADVRRFPGSRRLPRYAAPALEAALDAHGIAYTWLAALGARVVHVRDEHAAEEHRIAAPARLVGGRLTYAAGDPTGG